MKKPTTINEYISAYPDEVKKLLEQMRATIAKAAPGAEEEMSYGIPCFKLNKRGLIYFAAFKKHIGFYPIIKEKELFKKELSIYKGGKGTVQFPYEMKLPLALVSKIVKLKVKENKEKVMAKKSGIKKTT